MANLSAKALSHPCFARALKILIIGIEGRSWYNSFSDTVGSSTLLRFAKKYRINLRGVTCPDSSIHACAEEGLMAKKTDSK